MTDNPLDSHPPRPDRRVARTRQALREAFQSLIREKGYDSITIEEITQRANLGRATFYLHYKDKEDLLLEQFSDLARDRVRLLSEIPLAALGQEADPPPYLPLVMIFRHAAEHAGLYRGVLRGEGAARITGRLREIIEQAFQELLQTGEQGGLRLQARLPVDFLSAYLAGAMIGSIAWWLEQETPPSPEEMTRMFQRMFFPGASLVLAHQENSSDLPGMVD